MEFTGIAALGHFPGTLAALPSPTFYDDETLVSHLVLAPALQLKQGGRA